MQHQKCTIQTTVWILIVWVSIHTVTEEKNREVSGAARPPVYRYKHLDPIHILQKKKQGGLGGGTPPSIQI